MITEPSVIETIGRSSKAFDLASKLLQDRIIFLGDQIMSDNTNSIIMQMLWLAADSPEEPISLYINSPGGVIYDGLAIKDIMDDIPCKVNTVGVGMCASMGAYLLAAGTGTRRVTKNCRIMLHSASSGTKGTIHDMAVDFNETKYMNDKLLEDIVSFSCGKLTEELLNKATQRDHYMNPEEAINMGIIDAVV